MLTGHYTDIEARNSSTEIKFSYAVHFNAMNVKVCEVRR
jgi:hypothetical protein